MQPKYYFSNPVAQFQSYKAEINEAITKVLENGPYILGPQVGAFESEFANYNNTKYCAGVGSGTDALALTLKAFGIGSGDEVITVSHTALATTAAIVMAGAIPVLVDIEEDYFTIDASKIENYITPKTKAVIPVHIYGQPCDMDNIMQIAKKYNLIVIEDCAQAHGALYKGKKVGSIGDAGCFSFYPTKNLGGIGDGGGVITNNKVIYERLKRIRQYGWDKHRIAQEKGVVSRLDELQATILRVKLKYLDQDNQRRKTIATHYKDLFKNSDLVLPKVRENCEHVYHLYVVKSKNRDDFKEKLSTQNIEAGIHYTHPVHMHQGYLDVVKISKDDLDTTNKIVKEILTMPIYPELDFEEIKTHFSRVI